MIPLNSMVALWTAMVPLAEEIPDPNDVKPGWVGFTVVVVLMVAVVLLWLSFRKQLKKVNFEEPSENGDTGTAADGPAGGSSPGNDNGQGRPS
ncbi:MAG TPA: hypothetical protein VF012_01780 [Nocardioidaceae bacterium]